MAICAYHTEKQRERVHLMLAALMFFLLAFPLLADAGLTRKADEMCTPVITACPCMTVPCKSGCCGGMNMHLCACWDDPPTGHVQGICVAEINCKGQTFTDQQGQAQGMGDAGQFMDMLKQLMQKGGGGGGGGGQPQQGQGLEQGCTSYYQVTAPTTTDSCAIHAPAVSDSLLQGGIGDANAARDLLKALGAPIDTAGIDFGASVGKPDTSALPVSAPARPGPQTGQARDGVQRVDVVPQAEGVPSNNEGDIVESETGATIFARVRDARRNVEEAGFFGIDTVFGTVRNAVANMCRSRPWDGSFVSYLIPPSFFDGLCTWRGYEVGMPSPLPPEPPAAPAKKKSRPPPASPVPAAPTAPKVDIWAVPPQVPLGKRVMIFWNARGVETCSITSPEGSFNENSPSGGAATVPLTGPTTFTISCLTGGGTPVTDFVTVGLSI